MENIILILDAPEENIRLVRGERLKRIMGRPTPTKWDKGR